MYIDHTQKYEIVNSLYTNILIVEISDKVTQNYIDRIIFIL